MWAYKMQPRNEHAIQQAKEARDRALLCPDKVAQDKWLKVARLWDSIAGEYDELDALKVRMAADENTN